MAVATHGERTAISASDQQVSYSALQRWSDGIANALDAPGYDAGQPVLIFLSRPVDVIAAMIGCLKAGLIFAPIDPEQALARLRKQVSVASPGIVIHDDTTRPLLHGLGLQGARELSIASIDVAGSHTRATNSRDPDSAAYLYFTSGSTGEPKGILGRFKSIGHFVNWEIKALALDSTVRVSQLTTPSFDAILRDIFTPLTVGGTVCIPPRRTLVADGAALARWLDDQSVTLLHTVPSALRILLRSLETQNGSRPGALKHVCVAGEPLLPIDVARFFKFFGSEVELVNLYGPSETTMIKLFHRVRHEDADRASVPIGKPIDGARVVVLDARQRPVGTGMIGEIYIRTPYRTLGYFRRPDLTNEVFVPNPMSDDPDDIVYRSGDLGRMLENGDVEFAGRRDRQVKINGVRIEIAEVENVIREHPSITDVAIVERQGLSGGTELVAYVVMTPPVSHDELRNLILERAHPGMVPSYFVSAESLPRSATGKLNYAELPQPEIAADDGPHVAPETPLEQAVAEIWTDLLQIDAPSIDAHFFRVGGHSLLAMQVLSRIEAAFSVNVPLRDFLINPTIRGLAEHIAAEMLAANETDDYVKSLLEST
jgi:amino acid adenylation domain-containing protein